MVIVFPMYYTICMVVAIAKRGRPYYVAEINFANDAELEFREKFYGICANFHYQDIMALSRALGISTNAVERWKYKLNFPSWYVAMQVIDWDKHGRPVRKVSPWQSAVDMF